MNLAMDFLKTFFAVIIYFTMFENLIGCFNNFRFSIETPTLQFSFSYTSQLARLSYIIINGANGGREALSKLRSEFSFEMLENHEPLESAILNL